MSITVNVKDVGLKELVALYYNDNGTIREFKEIWTNDGTDVRCLFRKLTPLTWTALGDYAVINSIKNSGYLVNFKDFMSNPKNLLNPSGIRSNLFNLSQGKVITVNFTGEDYGDSTTILINSIVLLDSSGNTIQQSDIIESAMINNTVTLTVNTSGEYMLELHTATSKTTGGFYNSTVDAEITIE